MDLYIERLPTHLLVQHSRDFEFTEEAVHRVWITLAAACQKTNHKRVLWEGEIIARPMNIGQLYQAAAQAGKVALGLKLACVFKNFTPDERADFFKSVALRKGAIIQFFSERDAALEWLGGHLSNHYHR